MMDIELPEPPPMEANPEDIPLDVSKMMRSGDIAPCCVLPRWVCVRQKRASPTAQVVFEDEHVLVVNKPAGLVVHPSVGHEVRGEKLHSARRWGRGRQEAVPCPSRPQLGQGLTGCPQNSITVRAELW